MSNIPRPKLLRTNINPAGVYQLLLSLEDDLELIAEKLINDIEGLYIDTETGQPVKWEYKIEKDRRTNRAAALIYSNNESIRFREAADGKIAKQVRLMLMRGKVRISSTSNGVKFK